MPGVSAVGTGSAPGEPAVDLDRAVVELDDPEHRREAEAGAAIGALGLGGEVRLEHPGAQLLGDARAVVADLEDDVAPLAGHAERPRGRPEQLHVARADRDPAAALERIARVADEVQDHLLELAVIPDDGAAIARLELELQLEPDGGAAEQLGHGGDDVRQADHLGPVLPAAREPEQRPRERGGAIRDLVDQAERALAARIPLAGRELVGDQLDAEDQVVEVVRDAARERADRLEALRELEPLLGLGAGTLGGDLAADVEERDHHVRDHAVRAGDRPRERPDLDARVVRAPDHQIVDDHHLPLLERPHERHPVLGVRPPLAGADAVERRVVAGVRRRGLQADAHDLREHPVGVDLLAVRCARDPDPDREILAEREDDVCVGGRSHARGSRRYTRGA